MHRLSKIAFVGMLALAIAGCESGSQEIIAPTPSAPQVSAPSSFAPPLVAQNRAVTISAADGLIQPTNVNQRARQVQKGREDPFAMLFVPTVQKVPQKIVPQRPNRPSPPRVAARDSGSNPNRGNGGNQLPPVLPSSTLPVLPPPPPQQPDLARSVTVTGVVQVGSEPQAIVKVPNEATSRYVRVGQRLSNGQVLVKRIEVNEGSDPVVILEQYGTEVRRAVGEEPVNPTQTATPAAAIPAPPPPINNAFYPKVR